MSGWENLDLCTRRMFGVFEAEGYSPEPIAIFDNKENAEQYVRYVTTLPEDERICIDVTICVVELGCGRVWNNVDDPPPETMPQHEVEP